MAAVVFRLNDRGYGLNAEQAQFLAGQLQRRLTVPAAIERLSDEIWRQSALNPDAAETSSDIELDREQHGGLLDTLTTVRPNGDATAWDALAARLRQELTTEPQ